MTNRMRSPENMNESFGSLHRMILDEPLNVWIGVCAPHELEATLSACCELPGGGEVTLVLCLPREVQAANATRALARAGSLADTLVLVATDEDRLRWGALGENDLCAVARGTGRVRVLVEPDPKRAVVGSMQWLRRDDTFCVVWSREQGRSALEALIGLGVAWRGAWDEPEDGEFHAFPRGPDGFYTHDHQATDDGTKQGEDR